MAELLVLPKLGCYLSVGGDDRAKAPLILAKKLKKDKNDTTIDTMIILSIETSCDDTCGSIIKATGRKNPVFEILSNVRSSQIDIHQEFGGIVPNLAARAHVENMPAVLKQAFKNAGMQITNGKEQIDLITVTSHPGLIPCLLIGTNVARTLAWVWKKPIIGVNHLEGHIYANWLSSNKKIEFPAMSLIVSGGHTQLVLMKKLGSFKIIGETRDDAAGEAFDKVARLLGLPFPGGPPLSKSAEQGNPNAYNLPSPMIQTHDYDFSFSGLKTAVLYLVQDLRKNNKRLTNRQIQNISASFQEAIIRVLITKTIRAAKQYKAKTIILGGGVVANKELRKQMARAVKKDLPKTVLYYPSPAMAVDNAAMIAIAGYFQYLEGNVKTWKDIKARAVV